jgi:glycosyltransferase involved in cell wall biosynthesis
MTIVILNAARNVWLSIPAWEKRLKPYQLGRTRSFKWLPVASTIPVINDSDGINAVRTGYVANGNQLVGHFGTYDRPSCELLDRVVPALLTERANCSVVLLGNGGEQMRADLVRDNPELADRLYAPGFLKEVDLSLHVSACDVLLQPFVDGVTSRRTSVMAGLAHGIPIITTKGRLTEPLWEESDAIVLVPAADWRALVENAISLLSHADVRSRLAVAGRELYIQNFSLARTITTLRSAAPES